MEGPRRVWPPSAGKTTLAARLQHAITNSAVVHTDDIARWHSRFGWADMLIDGVLVQGLSYGLTCGSACPQVTVRDRSSPEFMGR